MLVVPAFKISLEFVFSLFYHVRLVLDEGGEGERGKAANKSIPE